MTLMVVVSFFPHMMSYFLLDGTEPLTPSLRREQELITRSL